MIRQELTTKQQMRLSPTQLQTIALLGLPVTDLEARITTELENNPALEEGEDQQEETDDDLDFYQDEKDDKLDTPEDERIDLDAYMSDDEVPDYSDRSQTFLDQRTFVPVADGMSLQEHLLSQLGIKPLSETEQKIAEYIIGSIDDDGYMRLDITTLADGVAFKEGIDIPDEQVQRIWDLIRTFDPDGVAAKDLQDCLLLQLAHRPQTPSVKLATQIIKGCWPDFSERRFNRIQTRLHLTEDQIIAANEEISKLSPKPGNRWTDTLYERNKNIITPDFTVENIDGRLSVSLNNSNIPQLRINKGFAQTMSAYKGSAIPSKELQKATEFVKQKLDSAQSFIAAIRQRNETLIRTMEAIVAEQKEFFLEGDDASLHPMVLKTIAEQTGYDISTISRVSNQKYVQTEFGIFPLKHFFSDGISTDTGEEVSVREVRNQLLQFINNEDRHHPLTDDQLAQLLQKKGVQVARRTVSKYREMGGIPVARLRRSL